MIESFLKKSLASFLAVFIAFSAVSAQETAQKSREERWREDIRVYASELPKRHKNLFFHLPQAEFEKEAKRIEQNVSKLSDDEIIVALMTLTAKIGDAHTTIRQAVQTFSAFPIAVYRFKEGWYVLATDENYKEILGARLIKVGDKPIEKVVEKVSEVIAAENEYWLWSQFSSELQTAEVLQAKGIIKNKAAAKFGFVGRDGKKFSVEMKSVAPKDFGSIKLARFSDQIKMPLANQKPDKFYWFEYLPESKTLFIAYNRCVQDNEKPFAKFVEEAFAIADREKAEKVVVDLRRNGGGNSIIMYPLLAALKQRPNLTEKGKLFVLMGRGTFSSGFMNARELQFQHKAIWVGEPSGQKPNAYGEVRNFVLPNSQIKVNYSTKFFELVKDEKRGFLPVDVAVERTFADFTAGRDQALEWTLNYKQTR